MSEKAISPENYRRKIYVEKMVEVPSGTKFKIKRLPTSEFLRSGLDDIPNPFLKFIQKGSEENFEESLSDEESREFMEKFIKIVVEKGILEPNVLYDYDKEKEAEVLFWQEIDRKDQGKLINEIVGLEIS